MMTSHNPNRSLVHIFCLSLSSLLVLYSAIAVYDLVTRESATAAELAAGVVRIALGLSALGVLFGWGWFAEPLQRQVGMMGAVFEADYANLSTKSRIRLIVLVTMLSLLLELVLIRWLASVFPVYSFYKNFTMLACFLGLGAGYAVAERQPCAPALVLPMLALFVGVITLLRYDTGALYLIFSVGWLSTFDLPVYFLLGASFIVCACICYPVGQLCGKLLHSSNSLNAYGLNLMGSVLGVMALFVMSLYWLPPVIWFAVTGGILLLFVLSRDAFMPVGITSFCVLLAILAWPVQPETQRIYSPYQLLERTAKPDGLMQILSGGSYYQKVYNFADNKRGGESAEDRYVRAYYEFPYTFKKAPGRVAIVGSGSGNDVATALRMGADHVDAIEIDPAIAFLGTKYHPERPYDDRRVTLSINDARNFFRTADQKYDLIVYGVLDSHTALSHASNLRVDSYVYTREGIAEAFRLLKPDGVLSISFTLVNDALGFKLSKILSELPGAGKPLAVRVGYDNARTTAFIAKRGKDVTMPDANAFASIGFTNVSDYFAQPYPESAIPTDDWPFFYMVERAYPFTYMIALGIILLLSYFFVRRTIGFSDPIDRSYLPFFFLGSGFMLVETKAITELGLHLGGTWVVIAATIMLVLVMAFLANLIVTRTSLKLAGPAYAGLFLSLLVGYGFAVSHAQWTFGPPLMQLALSCVVLTIPLFFAGIIFSSLISEARINISTAFAYNLMGALFGGVMEYNSMYFGFAFLYLLALGFYVLAWAFSWKSASVRTGALLTPGSSVR
ncbi:spermine/spermidine synthase domain-containing protein [Bradyrhizobium sp.]